MKVTLDIPDGTVCAFLNSLQWTGNGVKMMSSQIDSEDLVDGNTVKLPRESEDAE